VGVLLWFAPWAVYWVLVGHAPLLIAAVVALAVAVTVMLSSRESSARHLGIGGVATFAVLAILPLVFSCAQRWVLPLSFAGLFAVLLTSRALGKSVAEAVAKADLPAAVVQTELFGPVVNRLTWIWLGALAAMSVSAVVPPIALSDATLHNTDSPLTYLCYWVVPFGILAAAAIASRIVADRMTTGFGDAVRKTSFVAFVDLEIDQLYYLATEHANREVGPGQEPYNVTVGAKGTALLGDDTRVSWPSTYKVRQRRS
jgi:small-conductance mechanosensitive channel